MRTIKDFEEFEIEYQLIKCVQELEGKIVDLFEQYREEKDPEKCKIIDEQIDSYRTTINIINSILYDNDIDSKVEEEKND